MGKLCGKIMPQYCKCIPSKIYEGHPNQPAFALYQNPTGKDPRDWRKKQPAQHQTGTPYATNANKTQHPSTDLLGR